MISLEISERFCFSQISEGVGRPHLQNSLIAGRDVTNNVCGLVVPLYYYYTGNDNTTQHNTGNINLTQP